MGSLVDRIVLYMLVDDVAGSSSLIELLLRRSIHHLFLDRLSNENNSVWIDGIAFQLFKDTNLFKSKFPL